MLHESELTDVILTISFKITAEIEIKNICFASFLADEVYRLSKAYNVCSFVHSLP